MAVSAESPSVDPLSQSDGDADGVNPGRRFAIGANVALAILMAAALLVAVNWISSLKNIRRDIASTGNYGISQRMKNIVGSFDGEIRLSLLYPHKEGDEQQQNTIDRLTDYCDELNRFSPNVQATLIKTETQREMLVTRISTTFGGEADKHKNALASFKSLQKALLSDLAQRIDQAQSLLGENTWLSDFPLFARVTALFREKQKEINEAAEEIATLAPEGGIPKYAEATEKAKATLSGLKKSYEDIAKVMSQLVGLADEAARPDSQYIAMLRKAATDARGAVDSLRVLVGQPNEAVPNDISSVLKAYADRGTEVGSILEQLVQRVDRFGRKFPMVRQHANWTTQVQMGPIITRREVIGVLQDAGRGLRRFRLGLLGVIDTGDPQQLRQALSEARKNAADLTQNATVCEQILTNLADRLAAIDEASKQLLEEARSGGLLKSQVASIDKVQKELEDLPELKLGSVADQLKEENTIIVEANNRIRVVDFATVWPVRESIAGSQAPDDSLGRTFNGDSALSAALVSLSSDKPFATVFLVSYEPPAPRQQNPFMPPPPQSSIPTRGLSEIRQRLEAANFKVVDWNLATQKEKPPSDEGVNDLFVVLPPAPAAPPNRFGGGPPPGKPFGEEHRKIIQDLLDKDARAIFLATWEVAGGGFSGRFRTPPYGYGPLLEKDWGLQVNTALRMVNVEPDLQSADGFTVGLRSFQYLPVNGFSDQPIGKPMRGTRFLVVDACPIETTDDAPQTVNSDVVLSIPQKEQYIGAGINEIIEIINKLNDPKSHGVVQMGRSPRHGPFNLMVTAERKEGDQNKGRIAVMGFGGSLRDRYLRQPILADTEKVRFDPPPKENVELFINALYWLNDKSEYIGRGPVPVPRIGAIPANQWIVMRGFVWVVWPLVVFVPGIVLWYIRRR